MGACRPLVAATASVLTGYSSSGKVQINLSGKRHKPQSLKNLSRTRKETQQLSCVSVTFPKRCCSAMSDTRGLVLRASAFIPQDV